MQVLYSVHLYRYLITINDWTIFFIDLFISLFVNVYKELNWCEIMYLSMYIYIYI